MSCVVETRGLAVGYAQRRGRTRTVLAGLDLCLQKGELTCLLGPNGSGKSTLLRTLAGMQPPLAGSALLGGTPVGRLASYERARRLAVVLTDPVDAGLMRAADFVALGRYPHTNWSGRLRERDREAVTWALEATGSTDLADRAVVELSDGERQRVAIARALAQEPEVLALDEPIAFVDVPRRVELTGLLRRLARQTHLAVLLTTHDLDLAIRSADTLWLVGPGDARQVRVGAPEDLVLAGAVGRAFPSEEVTYDLADGTFRSRPAALGRALVLGSEIPARWVARALEREGLAVVGAGERADLTVEVLVANGPTAAASPYGDLRLRLTAAGHDSVHESVRDLVVAVRALVPAVGQAVPSDAGGGAGRA